MQRDQRFKLLRRAIHSIDKEIMEDKEQKQAIAKAERDKMDRFAIKARK